MPKVHIPFARDDKGDLREIAIGLDEEKSFGQVVVALPDTFPAAKNLVTTQGRLLKDDGNPFVGGAVLVKTDINNQRPVPGEQREKLQGTLGFSEKIHGTGKEQKQTAPEPEKTIYGQTLANKYYRIIN